MVQWAENQPEEKPILQEGETGGEDQVMFVQKLNLPEAFPMTPLTPLPLPSPLPVPTLL